MPDHGIADYASSALSDPESFDASEIIHSLDFRNYNLADYSYEVIMDLIRDFEDSLDAEHKVGARLASFGQSILMSITDVGYANPSTLIFEGIVDGQRATLIQHMSQLNFLLLAVRRKNPQEPKKKIGFTANWEEE